VVEVEEEEVEVEVLEMDDEHTATLQSVQR
jgi:hypothetical protein